MPFAQLVATWPSLLLLLALPWVAALLAALAQGLVHKRLLSRARTLSQPARRWLAAQALGQGMQTRIEVHAALAEAYFPHADTVGLSPRAAGSAHPVHRAVVAHELGHAATAGLHPLLRGALPEARVQLVVPPVEQPREHLGKAGVALAASNVERRAADLVRPL